MKYCPNCGVQAEEDQKFCGDCGARLTLDPLPTEPVYTEDERLKNDPALASHAPEPKPGKKPRVPELTLEPDLWGYGAAAAAAAPARPAEAAPAPQAAEAAPVAVEQREAPDFAPVTEEIPYEREAPDNVPNDYTMSARPDVPAAKKAPDETLMLIWSIILTCLFSICGIVGLVKTIKARKTQDPDQKAGLLNAAKIWLIIGTVLHLLPYLAELL